MVPQEAPDLDLSRRHRVAAEGDGDLAVIVAQVAVGGDRPEVDPLADVSVAEEAFVVLVGVAVDDGMLDLAADAAVGAEGDAPAQVGPEELGIAADVAGPFHAGERLDDDPGGDGDRAAGGVEDGVRVDPGRLVDREAIGGADQGERREVAVARGPWPPRARSRGARCSSFLATRSQGRAIHSPPRSMACASEAVASNQASTPPGFNPAARSGPTQAQEGRPSQVPTQGRRPPGA